MKYNSKIKLKTILTWFLFSLTINKEEMLEGKYPHVDYRYTFKVRYIPAILFYIVAIVPYILGMGVSAVPKLFIELFILKHTSGDRTQPHSVITRTFAYNRF